VREAVFNALGSLGAVEDADVLDAFAGSGALGIEALSRGARHAWFLERSTAALDAVRRNLATVGFEGRATVCRGDALELLARPAASGLPEVFDLALLDPPYRFDRWEELLGVVRAGTLVLESDRELQVGPDAVVVRVRRYGGTVVTVARADRDDHGGPDPEDRS
jgi:16S rRNA (guanine966-N2)-methyltransferase